MNIEKEGYRLMKQETGEYYPWYTHPALEVLDTMDLSDKVVFEYGIGDSSLWWAKRCKKLYGVEYSKEWFEKVCKAIGDITSIENNVNHLVYNNRWEVTNRDAPNLYINSIYQWNKTFDIVIIDGLDRDECVEPALACLKKGGLLIFDNWMQPSVCVQSEEVQKRLLAFRHEICQQPGHGDWKTAFFYND